MLQNKLSVFENSRALIFALENEKSTNKLLHTLIVKSDFFNKIIFFNKKQVIDEDERKLLLFETLKEDDFIALGLPNDFLSFYNIANEIIDFIKFLSWERIDEDKLKSINFYKNYKLQIDTLVNIKDRYTKVLNEKKIVDKILLPEFSVLDFSYINNFDTIDFYADLENKFEEEIVNNISKKKQVYRLEDSFQNNNKKIYISSFSQQILQISYLKQKISYFINKGYTSDEMAVITFDSKTVDFIKLFDEENIFYDYFGKNFEKSYIYKKLSSLYNFVVDKNQENRYRYKRFWGDEEEIIDIKKLFAYLIDFNFNQEEKSIVIKEIENFGKILNYLKKYSFVEQLNLFLNRLNSKLKQNMSGAIKILDIEQVIDFKYKVLIFLDFNESKVLRNEKKSLFLSNFIDKYFELEENKKLKREKYLIKKAIYQSEEVVISYIEDGQSYRSRLLDELELDFIEEKFRVQDLLDILFKSNKILKSNEKEIILDYDFTKIDLSASRLKIFLDCPRKYYYRYIKKLHESKLPTDEVFPQDIGIILHEVLYDIYSEKKYFFDEKELFKQLKDKLNEKIKGNIVLKFYADLWLKNSHKFIKTEIDRFKNGYRIYLLEKKIYALHNGIKIFGQIDRIEIKENQLYVLDYKSGKIPKTTKNMIKDKNISDFQLQFYYLLSSQVRDTYLAYYYDLNSGKIIEEEFFDEKLEILNEVLDDLAKTKVINFQKCENERVCTYCPYKIICERE